MTLAQEINSHLESGGVVQVTTAYKSWIYRQKHVNWFFMRGDNLHVKNGKSDWQLSIKDRLLVGIRFGREVAE